MASAPSTQARTAARVRYSSRRCIPKCIVSCCSSGTARVEPHRGAHLHLARQRDVAIRYGRCRIFGLGADAFGEFAFHALGLAPRADHGNRPEDEATCQSEEEGAAENAIESARAAVDV